MFGNIAWSELLIIAGIALVVIGPKELPAFLRVAGRYFGKLKGVADDFRSQFDDVVRETQVNDIKDNILKEVEGVKSALPSEKDIGLDFSELDADVGKPKHDIKFDDEDENLDWDEPDEVIETNAAGEVTHHSKSEDSKSEQRKDETPAIEETKAEASQNSDAETEVASTEKVAENGVDQKADKTPKDQKNQKSAKTKQDKADDQKKSDLKKVASSSDDDDDYDFDEDDGALLDEADDGQASRTSMDVLAEGREKFKESLEEGKASKSVKHAEAQSTAANG